MSKGHTPSPPKRAIRGAGTKAHRGPRCSLRGPAIRVVVTKLDRLGLSLDHFSGLSKNLQGRTSTWWCSFRASTRPPQWAAYPNAPSRDGPRRGPWPHRRSGGQAHPRQARIAQEMYAETDRKSARVEDPRSPPQSTSPCRGCSGQGSRQQPAHRPTWPVSATGWSVDLIGILATRWMAKSAPEAEC